MSESESDEGQSFNGDSASRPKRTATKKPMIDSDSSSDSDSPMKSRSKKAKRSGKDDFPDDLFDGADDNISGMNELEREMVYYKRMEENEIKKQREELRQKLKAGPSKGKKKGQKKAALSDDEERKYSTSSESEGEIREPKEAVKRQTFDDDDDEPDMDYHRPSEVQAKHNKKKAMNELLMKRRDKKEAEEKRKEQEKNREALDIDEIFGLGENRSGSSSSSSSRSTSRSSSRSSSRTRSPTPEQQKQEITSPDQLRPCVITRKLLAQFVHLPLIRELAIGCFVRVGIGVGVHGKSTYRVAEIIDVMETAKIYNVEGTRTNKGLKIRFGDAERVYRLEFISNQPFTVGEYNMWESAMKDKNLRFPTLDQVEERQKMIAKFAERRLNSSEFEEMIKEKQRFQKGPTNFAVEKSRLMKEKADAEEANDHDRVKEIQIEIDELDQRANDVERARNEKLLGVTWINQKRRDEMKQNFLDPKKMNWDPIRQDDPFTRKSNRTKMVSGTSKKPKDEIKTEVKDEIKTEEDSSQSASNSTATSIGTPASTSEKTPTSKPKFSDLWQKKTPMSKSMQFAKHLDVELDLDI